MARAVDQHEMDPVTATAGHVAVAQGDQSPAASAVDGELSDATQRTHRRRSVSNTAKDEACPSRVASADWSLPAKRVTVKSAAAKSLSAKGVSATRTKASVTRPRKKPEIDVALPEIDTATLAGAVTATTGGEIEAGVERSRVTSVRTTPRSKPPTNSRASTQAKSPTASRGRAGASARKRASGMTALAGRIRLAEWQAMLALPDTLFSALPALRQAALNAPLDEALALVAHGVASALAPAAARIWTADVAPWSSSASRVGGSGVAPGLRLRARSFAAERGQIASGPASTAASALASGPIHDGASSDPLLVEVASARRPTLLFDAVGHPLARTWTERTSASGEGLPSLGTLAAYPLLARGQFLGVLAVGAASRLSARQLAALEELADLLALAADRDRLLSYSRSSEALSQTVVRHAPVAMALITGPEYTLALANPAFAQLLGLEGETALVGKRLAEVIPQRVRTVAVSLRLDAAYAGDEPQAMIELPMHRESRVTYWNVTTSPVTSVARGGAGSGALVAAVEVTRQVMARQRAQESADVAEERLRQMMSLHAASLAVASQLDADPRELLADLLTRSIGLLGALAGTIYVRDPRHDTLEVVISQGLHRDYTGRYLEPGQGLAGQVARARRGLIVDDYRCSPYGAGLYVDEAVSAVIAVPLVHHNDVVGVLEVLDDGERRSFSDADLWLLDLFAAQAAQAIQNARMYVELERAYRKQRELDRLKDDFIATASHELRTPLTGVQGFLELLLDLPAAQADPLLRTFARKAASAAEELTEITERLLQTSRLDTGRLELHTAPVRLAPVVTGVLAAFREHRATREGGHELVAQVEGNTLVLADPARLKELLDNLVSNAIKYSPRGGRITVACGPFGEFALQEQGVGALDAERQQQSVGQWLKEITERPTVIMSPLTPEADTDSPTQPRQQALIAAETQPYVLLTVADQGIGIPEGERARLFGRFARLDGARVSQIRGTGLGLYICRQLARSMGGDVWLQESEPGEGSVFALALPAAAESPSVAPHADT